MSNPFVLFGSLAALLAWAYGPTLGFLYEKGLGVPQDALQANPTLFLDKTDTPKWLWSLLGSLDLFSLWHVFLLASGFGVASKRSTGSAVWGVAAGWGILVLGKVAFTLFR